MKGIKNFWILILIASFNSKSFAIGALEAEMLNSYINDTEYQIPSEANLQKAKKLFESILKNKLIHPNEVNEWKKLGFTLKKINEKGEEFAIISEIIPSSGKGHGFYIIKLTTNDSNIIVQAPHRPSDMFTHLIIYKLLIENNILAGAWNSTYREVVDLGKEQLSYFNAFTEAVAKIFNKPKILQFHAFDSAANEIDADLILSGARKKSTPELDDIKKCLNNNLDEIHTFQILQYPKDINMLGGVLNVNAKKFYKINREGLFLHLEMSKKLRQQLNENNHLRDLFFKCFIEL